MRDPDRPLQDTPEERNILFHEMQIVDGNAERPVCPAPVSASDESAPPH